MQTANVVINDGHQWDVIDAETGEMISDFAFMTAAAAMDWATSNGYHAGEIKKAHLYLHIDARGNEWYTVVDRAGQTLIETRDSDAADKVADKFSEIIGYEDYPAKK